ncbi:hypothetical protein ORI94_16540 [Streptomyces sp. NEAU-W12]|nr:hypothetical protein [Streptomyces sp. NEAU-W12]
MRTRTLARRILGRPAQDVTFHLQLADLLAQGRDLRVLRGLRERLGPLGVLRGLDPLPQRLVVHAELGGDA